MTQTKNDYQDKTGSISTGVMINDISIPLAHLLMQAMMGDIRNAQEKMVGNLIREIADETNKTSEAAIKHSYKTIQVDSHGAPIC